MSKGKPRKNKGNQADPLDEVGQSTDPLPRTDNVARSETASVNSESPDQQGESRPAVENQEAAAEIQEVLRYEVQQSLHFRGPYPHPEILKSYEEILPGSAQTIFDRAGKEQEFRHKIASEQVDLEHRELTHGVVQGYVGQACAFVIAMTAIVGGIYLIAADKSGAGLASILSALFGLVIAFVTGKYLESKSPLNPSSRPTDEDAGMDS